MMRIGMVVLSTFLGATALAWWWAAVNIYPLVSCGADCYVTPQWASAVPLAVAVGAAAALIVLGTWAVLRRFRSPA